VPLFLPRAKGLHFMKHAWCFPLLAVCAVLLSTAVSAQGKFQSCDGVLRSDEYHILSLDPGRTTVVNWCDADFGSDDIERTVLGVCQVGDRCHVEGYFAGHGAFSWIRLTKVENLSRRTQPAKIYTPSPGQPERQNIMDAIRLVWCPDAVFAVQALVVAREGDKAIAAATIDDSSHQSNCATTVVLEGLNEQWRAEYNYGGDGARSCKDALALQKEILGKLSNFGLGAAFLPGNFTDLLRNAEKNATENDAGCAVTDKF
jgi:hypothetical protein